MAKEVDVGGSLSALNKFAQPILELQKVLEQALDALHQRDNMVFAKNKEEKDLEKFRLKASEEMTKVGADIQAAKKELESIKNTAVQRKEAASLLASQEQAKVVGEFNKIKRETEEAKSAHVKVLSDIRVENAAAIEKAKAEFKSLVDGKRDAEAELRMVKNRITTVRAGIAQAEAG